MNPIDEIIVKAKPSYVLGDDPLTFVGNCPLHKNMRETLQFEWTGDRVKIFCHACHYEGGSDPAKILAEWWLETENLYVLREYNPSEAKYIEAKANLIRLDLMARRLHGLEWNDNVRKRYLAIINERLPWVELLDEYWTEDRDLQGMQK